MSGRCSCSAGGAQNGSPSGIAGCTMVNCPSSSDWSLVSTCSLPMALLGEPRVVGISCNCCRRL
eukprot:1656589-Prorocentrum_lima.AAC.1